MLRLAKYIINSNSNISDLKNPDFIDILDKSINVPSYHMFRNRVLPELLEKLHALFTLKMNKADSICLITDIWTTRSLADFIALAAVLIKSNYTYRRTPE